MLDHQPSLATTIYDRNGKVVTQLFQENRNWKESIEDDFIYVKQISEVKSNFTLIDYIRYKYENKQTDLTYDEFVDALSILNNIMRKEVK